MNTSKKSAWALAVAIMWASPATAQITDPEWLAGLERSMSEWACVQRIKAYLAAPSTMRMKRTRLEWVTYKDPSDDTDIGNRYNWWFQFEAANRFGVPLVREMRCNVYAMEGGIWYAVELSGSMLSDADREEQKALSEEDFYFAYELWNENERRANQRDFKNK